MKKLHAFLAAAIAILITSCSILSPPPPPQEQLISVQLRGTATEVQQFIESHANRSPNTRVESPSDRMLIFKTDCLDCPKMNPFRCATVRFGLGEGYPIGPFDIISFRTSEVHGIVNVTATTEWCGENYYGRTRCMQNASNTDINTMLKELSQAYSSKIRPL